MIKSSPGHALRHFTKCVKVVKSRPALLRANARRNKSMLILDWLWFRCDRARWLRGSAGGLMKVWLRSLVKWLLDICDIMLAFVCFKEHKIYMHKSPWITAASHVLYKTVLHSKIKKGFQACMCFNPFSMCKMRRTSTSSSCFHSACCQGSLNSAGAPPSGPPGMLYVHLCCLNLNYVL